jgi:phosphoribosylformylglycinamidine (FGAM) synthase-like enzyme
MTAPGSSRKNPPSHADDVPAPNDLVAAVMKLMGSPDMSSRRWVWEQYDNLIQSNTAQIPGGDAAVVRVSDDGKAIAVCTDVTPRYVEADPFEGGKQAVAEVWRNLTAVGADPIAITDNLNFGNPRKARDHGHLRQGRAGHRRGLPRARLPRRVGQRLALQRNPRPGHPAHARPLAASA